MSTAHNNIGTSKVPDALLQTLREVAILAIDDLVSAAKGNVEALTPHLQSLASAIAEAQEGGDIELSPASFDVRELMEDMIDLLKDVHSAVPADAIAADLRGRVQKYSLLQLPKQKPMHVIASVPLERWDVMAGNAERVEDEPAYTLNVSLDRAAGQMCAAVMPVGRGDAAASEGLPQLLVMVEVNNGAPCAHLYSDAFGEVAMSVFGMPGARLAARPGDAPVDHQDRHFEPEVDSIAASLAGRPLPSHVAQPRMR